jgi:hypothetical protein
MSNKKTRYFVAVMGTILAVGLGTGLVASYMGLPVSVFSSAAGPEELQYVPADAAVVAYANVRDVMNSQLRQRFRRRTSRTSSRKRPVSTSNAMSTRWSPRSCRRTAWPTTPPDRS